MFKLIPIALSIMLAGGATVATQNYLRNSVATNVVSQASLQSNANIQLQSNTNANIEDQHGVYRDTDGFIGIMH